MPVKVRPQRAAMDATKPITLGMAIRLTRLSSATVPTCPTTPTIRTISNIIVVRLIYALINEGRPSAKQSCTINTTALSSQFHWIGVFCASSNSEALSLNPNRSWETEWPRDTFI